MVNRVEFTSTSALNHSVVFLKENDVILANDMWHVALDLNTNAYEEIISTIRADLLAVEQRRKEFTFTSELQSIETLLTTLESKLHSFKQILPKLDPRRGLLYLGATMLKALFGTAIVSDVTQLHNFFDELQSSQQNIVHSIDNQITYIKKLDSDSTENAEFIANLSSVIRDCIIRSHDRFQQITKYLLWLNLTVYGQSELFTMIRELEFSILQLTQRLDELTNAIQYVVMGSLPANLINPHYTIQYFEKCVILPTRKL